MQRCIQIINSKLLFMSLELLEESRTQKVEGSNRGKGSYFDLALHNCLNK